METGGNTVGVEKAKTITSMIRKFKGLDTLLKRYTLEDLETMVKENCKDLEQYEIQLCVEEILSNMLEDLEDVKDVEDQENVEDLIEFFNEPVDLKRDLSKFLSDWMLKRVSDWDLERYIEIKDDKVIIKFSKLMDDGCLKNPIRLNAKVTVEDIIELVRYYGIYAYNWLWERDANTIKEMLCKHTLQNQIESIIVKHRYLFDYRLW